MKSEMNKRDRKGKSEQVAKYIRKLGARIKCLLGREDADMDGTVKRSGLREAADVHESSSHRGASNATDEEIQEQASSSASDDEWTGLAPFIYRAIKARRARRYSRCRSTGSAHALSGAHVEEEDGAWDQSQWEADGKVFAARDMTHASLEELAGEVEASLEWRRRGGAEEEGCFSCISDGT
ncbi:unnamed protein product [Urochloa decumbens]|uniref:Uncharacterized protein n=1 Tax=Urochloa decumbens TaxID=240449 RepID=A0ABC9AA65_9POAL